MLKLSQNLFIALDCFLILGVVTSLTVKDLRPCSNTDAPMLNSVVAINCTEEPCFFGQVNGLSFQFILTPDHDSSSVSLQLTALDRYGNNYDIETGQRTNCANSHCEMEANVPRCFAASVRRRYAPDYDQVDYFTFQARFIDSKGYCVACSRFGLNTFIRYTKETYDYTTTMRPYQPYQHQQASTSYHETNYHPTTSRPIYSTNRPYQPQTTYSPYIVQPIGSSFSFDKKNNNSSTSNQEE